MNASAATKPKARNPAIPVQKRAIKNRKAILDAARRIFARYGFDGAGTRMIAAEAGIKQGSLVYYFESKEELWKEVVETFAAECLKPLRIAASEMGDRPVQAIAPQALRDLLQTFADNPDGSRLVLSEVSITSPRRDWLLQNFARSLWGLSKPIFEALGREGLLSGASPFVAYFNLMSCVTMVFGAKEDFLQVAQLDELPQDEQHIQAMLRPIFAPA